MAGKKTPQRKPKLSGPKDNVGRPPLLDAALRQKLTQAIRLGMSYEKACALVGISYGAFRKWVIRGQQEEEGEYVELVKDLKKAEAQGEAACLQRIHLAAQGGQWQASAWLLERRHPDQWGRNRVEVSGPDGAALTIKVEYVDGRSASDTDNPTSETP